MKNSADIDEKIELASFNPEWGKIYKVEAQRLKNQLEFIDIQHIGSTSVPNIYAKPIIDIMIGTNDLQQPESIIEKIIKLGYEYFGEANVPGRLYFRKRNQNNFNIALCQYNGDIWVNNLLFRDYLTKHSDVANTYSLLKKNSFDSGANTLLKYSDIKKPFIVDVIKKAKAEKGMYSPEWPHGQLKEIFANVFFVTGTNITTYNNVELQHSRNMVILRDNSNLTLINAVRLNAQGLAALNKLGTVKNIVRIGAFHGRDDAFYRDHYHARLWVVEGMSYESGLMPDVKLTSKGEMPLPNCCLFTFETSTYPEGALLINEDDGILITCDSIKNWVKPDKFFNPQTAELYEKQGFFGTATISEVWRQACQVKAPDFIKLKELSFKHLISAHGEPLLNNAHELVAETIKNEYGV